MYMTIATFLKSAAWSELGLGGPSLVWVVRAWCWWSVVATAIAIATAIAAMLRSTNSHHGLHGQLKLRTQSQVTLPQWSLTTALVECGQGGPRLVYSHKRLTSALLSGALSEFGAFDAFGAFGALGALGALGPRDSRNKCTQHSDVIGSCSEANYLMRNSAMDDSIGGS